MKLIPDSIDSSGPGSLFFGLPKLLSGLTQLLFIILLSGCVAQFIPETEEEKELVVVEGLITDQPGPNTIKLSKSLPFGKKSEAKPLSGCVVSLKDDLENYYQFHEKVPGTYITDSSTFRGQIGRFYTLRIRADNGSKISNYESSPVEMKAVPPVDSIYYEKTVIREGYKGFFEIDGCNIFLNTHDPENICKYYRWDFNETWAIILPFPVEKNKCWVSDTTHVINFKSTAAFNESRIAGQPITFISNVTDKLKAKYSISVNQYSLNEDEYIYWEKLQNITGQVGGLYDVIPSSVPSNIFNIDNPEEKVLGYFSVSARSSGRTFIKDKFAGIIDRYTDCIIGYFYGDGEIPGLGTSVWVLSDDAPRFGSPRRRTLTDKKGCADCRVRGTDVKPEYWVGD